MKCPMPRFNLLELFFAWHYQGSASLLKFEVFVEDRKVPGANPSKNVVFIVT